MTSIWPQYWRSEPTDPTDPDSVAEWIAVTRPDVEDIRRVLHELSRHWSGADC